MKKFSQARITLFDSTIASFKLSVEANFTRDRQDGSTANLAYITDKGTAVLNPSIYLVFSFKGETYDTTKNVYTSFPQLFAVRETLETIKDLLVGNKAYVNIEGVLNVRPEFQQPFVIDNIGKQSKWISFTLVAIEAGQEGMPVKIPGVSIAMPESEYVSVLTAEEMLTIYSIIKDLDLTGYLIQLSNMFLSGDDQPVYAAPQPVVYTQPAQQPYGGGYAPATQPARTPSYGRNPMARTQPRTATTGTPVQPTQTFQQPSAGGYAPVTHSAPAATWTAQPSTTTTPAGLPPRKQEKQIVNMKSIEETQISTFNLDDEDAVNSIFEDDKE